MQQFIPFDDDWDALANLRLEDLVPYRVGMLRDPQGTTVAAFSAGSPTSACKPPLADTSVS